MIKSYIRRKLRVRSSVVLNNRSSRPRIVVYRSNKNIYAQLLNTEGAVINSYSTLNFKDFKKASGLEKAEIVGKEFAQLCIKSGITKVVFDKGAYSYGGRVQAVANACRKEGLQF